MKASQVQLVAIALLAVLFFGASVALADPGEARKQNLDLPFNAVGYFETEELAPEMVLFFGEQIEADAIVFVLDASGSMDDFGRWEMQAREVVRSVSDLSEDIEFSVVFYNTFVRSFRNTPVPATVDQKNAAVGFIMSRQPVGTTCLFEGLIRGLTIARKSPKARKTVILTSDGLPMDCQSREELPAGMMELHIARSLAANPGKEVPVNTVWIGAVNDPDALDFMRRLAQLHNGKFRSLEN